MKSTRHLLALTLAFIASGAFAQSYPSKTVRIIVPYPAGGGNDLVARMIGQKLTDSLGQTFVVENRPGAGGSIGMDAVAKAAPDGHTLLVAPNNLAIVPSLFAKVPFDPIKDFAPVVLIVNSPGMIGVHSSVPVNTLQELFALAKAQPGKLNYTSCGTASPQHLAGELLKSMAGVNMQHIPFNGCAPAVADVAAGRIEVLIGTVSHVLPHQKAGRMKALATTGAQRSAVAPDYPTVAESGVPGYEADVWFAMFAPAKTPREIVMRLNAEVNKALQLADIRDKMRSQNLDIQGGPPEDLARVVASDFVRWGKVIRDVGIKPDQ
ncbi:MAG: tripartite tricarboxylate transporter substrate binding protein [Burkholderiales bacterium]